MFTSTEGELWLLSITLPESLDSTFKESWISWIGGVGGGKVTATTAASATFFAAKACSACICDNDFVFVFVTGPQPGQPPFFSEVVTGGELATTIFESEFLEDSPGVVEAGFLLGLFLWGNGASVGADDVDTGAAAAATTTAAAGGVWVVFVPEFFAVVVVVVVLLEVIPAGVEVVEVADVVVFFVVVVAAVVDVVGLINFEVDDTGIEEDVAIVDVVICGETSVEDGFDFPCLSCFDPYYTKSFQTK